MGKDRLAPSGSRLPVGRALLRYIGYFVNESLVSIDFLWAAFNPISQSWYDKLAGTLVVYVETEFNLQVVCKSPDQWLIRLPDYLHQFSFY